MYRGKLTVFALITSWRRAPYIGNKGPFMPLIITKLACISDPPKT